MVLAISTVLGVAPIASLFGSSYNQMGLVTQLCCLVCFFGVIAGACGSEARFEVFLWSIAIVGSIVATYAFMQFFGRDPFFDQHLYTHNTGGIPVVRPISTLGHSDYLGNLLLYTTPVSAALAISRRSVARHFGVICTGVSIAAVAFSGTRGAWTGLAVAAVVLVLLEARLRTGRLRQAISARKLTMAVAAAGLILGALVLISANPASRSVATRARLWVTEGFTGSGRTLLWRDALRMLPAYAVSGCGPEGFRLAFLPYKSDELSRLAPQINNESSHNSYLDEALTSGLVGAILYLGLVASAVLLVRDARSSSTAGSSVILSGLLAALAGVATHNFFIYDQIPNRLFFFVFLGLAYSARELKLRVAGELNNRANRKAKPGDTTTEIQNRRPGLSKAVVGVSLMAVIALGAVSAWYLSNQLSAETAVRRSFAAANRGDLDRVTTEAARALNGPDPTGDYHFLFAQAFALCADRLQERVSNSKLEAAEISMADAQRQEATRLAIERATRTLGRTLTPDSTHLLLAYLSLTAGDNANLKYHAAEAIRLDPGYANGHWLAAEGYLTEGNREAALREARSALRINPSSPEARSALRRARGQAKVDKRSPEQSIEVANSLFQVGKTQKARRTLLRAIERAGSPCPECRRLLALLYEADGMSQAAAAEWEKFAQETPDLKAAQEAKVRVSSLREK
jgi:O-antigen ligase/Tfp pilus assembly protein PilF